MSKLIMLSIGYSIRCVMTCPGWTPPLAQCQLGEAPAPARPSKGMLVIMDGWMDGISLSIISTHEN